MWVFAMLIVLAMGGIALVASGYGSPMARVYDDRPDAGVPVDGAVRGEDLRRVRFPLAVRGYRMAEVDALLARLATQLEQAEQTEETERAGQAGHSGPADPGPDSAPDTPDRAPEGTAPPDGAADGDRREI
ncbi:DivIVA domain-containing protein [Nocardioides sp. MJB4]|uniref:DivIVA domain-containing protein n=2 Tax=Nocardioides donggukensis TaxID=2774019 RepID=A0A927K5I4_9ACTN|nr:DivIVA domain-containing protein [Nocardioides donggukensis]